MMKQITKIYYLLIVISLTSLFSIIWSNTLTLNNKEIEIKLEIETNLEEKVTNVISRIYNTNQFVVTTNVTLLSTNQNSNNTQGVQSFGALELEGILPAAPNTDSPEPAVANNDYRVEIKDITIWLDSDLNMINAQNDIKSYLFYTMGWLTECEKCIQFKSIQFPNASSTSNESSIATSDIDNEDLKIIEENIEYILNQLDQLAESGKADGMSKNEWMIDYLNRALDEQKIENQGLKTEMLVSLKTEVLVNYKNMFSPDSLLKMISVENIKEIEAIIKAMDSNKEVQKSVSENVQKTIKSIDENTQETIETKLSPLNILNKSVNKLNGINTSFVCDFKLQSLSDEPKDFNFNFYSYWPDPDSLVYYNYVKFNSPIDWKSIEVWGYYDKEILIKKRIPINNEITEVNNESDNINVVDFFNFVKLAEGFKDGIFSIKDKEFKNKDIFLIKVRPSDPKSKKKAIIFYIDQDDYSIYKIEWTNKKGTTYKTLLFEKWIVVDNINMSSRIIYEDIKNGIKVTCKLSDIEINNINQETLDLINIGFKIADKENKR